MKSLKRRYFISDWLISNILHAFLPSNNTSTYLITFERYRWTAPLAMSYFRFKLHGNNVLFQCMFLRGDILLSTSLVTYSFCWLCSVLDALLLSEIENYWGLSIKRFQIVFTICSDRSTPSFETMSNSINTTRLNLSCFVYLRNLLSTYFPPSLEWTLEEHCLTTKRIKLINNTFRRKSITKGNG